MKKNANVSRIIIVLLFLLCHTCTWCCVL